MHRWCRHLAALCCAVALGMGCARAADFDWIKRSDRNAQVLLQPFAKYHPEQAGRQGVEGVDEQIVDLGPGVVKRTREDLTRAVEELKARRAETQDPLVRQDLEILIKAGENMVRAGDVRDRYLLPYHNVPLLVFGGIRALLDPRVAKARQTAALTRLKRYAGLTPDTHALVELARERTVERFAEKNLVGPYEAEVEQNLTDTQRYLEGIAELFRKSGLQGWEEAHARLARQFKDYNDWVRAEVLPRAREENRLPEPVYADNLIQAGVDISPRAMMADAQFAFTEIQRQMQALAPLVAKEKGFKADNYRDVVRELKKQQLLSDQIMPLYSERLAQIEAIVRRERIVTLPRRKASIRVASAAESAQQPAPHMDPPRLIGNSGEYGEFVLPLNVPTADGSSLKTDDFTFDAAAWTLTAHEARPGHELQFATMTERGVSIARAIFAFNSVNVEGWGLYSEAEMQPYEPLDAQLITLDYRLLRAARAFLDPMLNLGLIAPEAARQVLIRDIVASPGFAKQEIDRYTFRAPGQATSYFYGYKRLMTLRGETEVRLGSKFDRMQFNDFVVNQGLLPPDLMQKAVEDEFVPSMEKTMAGGAESPAGR